MYAQAIEEGLGTSAIVERVKAVFSDLKEQRIETIVRTETVRASNDASVEGWKQTGVVKAKEWWTAEDERVAPFDRSLHGKIIALEEDFFKKGDVLEVDGQKLHIDYTDIPAPPLHPNCRCTLLPITE
ncbi:MAG: minor capsid protein [Patescibacteria group bacterium]